MPGQHKRSTVQRGLGAAHRAQRRNLLQHHVEGTLCWWCDEPMFKAQGLQADHSHPRSAGGTIADRLLHGDCNNERGDGSRDHLRPALTGRRNRKAVVDLGHRAMAWPW